MPSQSKEDTYAYYYHTNYIRNARAIAIAWAIFTFCFAIIMVVVFVQPYWIGDDADALGTGYFGLYSGCFSLSLRGNLQCRSSVFDFSQITGYTTLIVATVFVGIAVICTLLSIVLMLLFLCKKPSTAAVFYICGTLQLLTGVCLLIGILVYPAGWSDHQGMLALCGRDLSYTNTDGCQLRWVFYLAIIAVFDAIILGILAFILANKQDKLHVDMHFSDYYQPKGKYEKKKSKKGSLRSNLFKSNASYANEAYDHDGQTRPNGKTASLDRRSVGSAESASAADVRTRSPSRNSAAHSEGRTTPSNSGSLSKRSGSGREPDYASVEPRGMRSKSNGSASNGSAVINDDGLSHHSTRSARSAHSAHSGRSAHSAHSAHSGRSAHSGQSSHSQRSGNSGSRAHDVVM